MASKTGRRGSVDAILTVYKGVCAKGWQQWLVYVDKDILCRVRVRAKRLRAHIAAERCPGSAQLMQVSSLRSTANRWEMCCVQGRVMLMISLGFRPEAPEWPSQGLLGELHMLL